MDIGLDGGFVDPVLQSQTAFRALMDALANPGALQNLATPAATGGGLTAELASILLTVSDHDTGIWLDDVLRSNASVLDFVSFHSGAPIVTEPGRAVFAFATGATHLPRLDQFNLGTQEYPDRSTTIVLAVEALGGGDEFIIRGPGIRDHDHISPVGLPGDFLAQWADNRELFPRGIDLLLVAEGQVMGLPRSTRIMGEH
jgi:alpha-D-ribose 1-methylphosphonate 5-triphosphate synthase subunit PhnH